MIRVFQVKCASEKKSEIEAHLLRKLQSTAKAWMRAIKRSCFRLLWTAR